MQNSPPRHNSFKLLLGLAIAGVGVAATIDKFDLFDRWRLAEPLFQFWPLLFVLVGLVKLVAIPGERFSGLVFTLLGGFLLLNSLTDRVSISDLWRFWPALLILLGIRYVVRSFGDPESRWLEIEGPQARQLGLLTVSRRRATSQVFSGGDLVAFMGGCELDLRDARPATNGAVLDVVAVWGGIEVVVPKGWQVDLQVVPVMGGAEDETKVSAEDVGHRLKIRGLVLMGGVEVHN